MKLYTPSEIAQFVLAHDFRDATERDVIEALKAWDKRMKADGAVAREAGVIE